MHEAEWPTVSVIIPAYNRERTIGRAIQSALRQSFQDFELVVVDDGSTDGTSEVVLQFNDPRIRLLQHERNRGEAAARNTGIKAARGTFLAFLDSDDEWLPDKLRVQLELLGDPSGGAHMCCSSYFLISEGRKSRYIHKQTPCWYKQLLGNCSLGAGTTLVLRRECVEKVGLLDEAFPRTADWDWLLRLTKAYKLSTVEEPLAIIYRTEWPRAEVVEASIWRLLTKYDADIKFYGWRYRQQVLSGHFVGLAYWFYRERHFVRGTRYLMRAFLTWPLQNPLYLLGLPLAAADALLGTSLIPWAHERRRLLRR